MSETNGKLNNSQRQALVKVLENDYDRRIQRQRERKESALTQVTQEVKSELGVNKIENELKELELRVKELEAQKEELGFNKYSDSPISGSEAHRMINEGISSEKERIAKLSSDKDQRIADIWTATELSEAKQLLDDILQD